MYEIERKWLFTSTEVPKDVELLNRVVYRQGYLSTDPEIRVYSEEGDNSTLYYLTFKSKGKLKRIEVEKLITKEDFYNIMSIGNIKESDLVQKPTSFYNVNGYTMVLCSVDEGTEDGFIYAEIEFETEEDANKFEVPSWFGEEVTYNDYYKMRNYWRRTRE